MTTRLSEPELETMLRQSFADHAHLADPDVARRVADGVQTAAAAPLWRRRGVLVAGLAASVALVAGVAGVEGIRDDRTSLPRLAHGPVPSVSATVPATPDTDAGHRAATQTAVRTALAAGPSLPGSRPATAGQTGEMGNALGIPGEHLVRQTGYALAPGTVDAAVAYLLAHPPEGFGSGGWGSGGARDGQFVDFEPSSSGAQDTDDYADLRLTVTVVPQGTGVAARTDAEAMWRPARLAATRLPADAQLRRITVSRIPIDARFGDSVVRQVTVTPRLQTAVTAAVAALRPAIPGYAMSCPASTVRVNDVFTFVSSQGTYVVTANQVCMGSVIVARDGVANAQVLGRAADLDDLVKSEPGTLAR